MAQFVVLARFTDQGIRGIKETPRRAKAFRDAAKAMGVTIGEIYWTLGHVDVVVTMEAADDAAVAALMMKMGALGNLTSQTLRAFTESEVQAIVSNL